MPAALFSYRHRHLPAVAAERRQVTAVLGYNRAEDIFLAEELQALGVTVRLLTADGSAGTCGLVTDGMEGVDYTHLYTCGPEAMLHAVWQRCRTDGQWPAFPGK